MNELHLPLVQFDFTQKMFIRTKIYQPKPHKITHVTMFSQNPFDLLLGLDNVLHFYCYCAVIYEKCTLQGAVIKLINKVIEVNKTLRAETEMLFSLPIGAPL